MGWVKTAVAQLSTRARARLRPEGRPAGSDGPDDVVRELTCGRPEPEHSQAGVFVEHEIVAVGAEEPSVISCWIFPKGIHGLPGRGRAIKFIEQAPKGMRPVGDHYSPKQPRIRRESMAGIREF